MERLTKAEEQVMQVLWQLGQGFAKDVLQAMPRPRPAITTVSTILRILEQKGFVGYEAFGRSHRYRPLLSKEVYGARQADRVLTDYFAGSVRELVSSFVGREELDAQELEALLKLLKRSKRK